MVMDQNRNEDVATFEKISGSYLNDLGAKLEELQKESFVNQIHIAEFEEVLCALQGRASAFLLRAEELGVENFKQMMDQAEEELQNAKEESEVLSSEILNESKDMLIDVDTQAQKVELLRVQFQNNKGLKDCCMQRSDLLDELKKEALETETEIGEMEAAEEEFTVEMQSFVEHDLALEYFQLERNQLHDEVADISFKLHHRRSDFPLPQ